MGAWGYDAMDSDQALDWLANNVTTHVGQKVIELLDEFGKNLAIDRIGAVEAFAYDLRAAGDVVLKLNFFTQFIERAPDAKDADDIASTLHSRLASALTYVRDDVTWMSAWDNPDAVRASLDKQIADLSEDYKPTTLMENLG